MENSQSNTRTVQSATASIRFTVGRDDYSNSEDDSDTALDVNSKNSPETSIKNDESEARIKNSSKENNATRSEAHGSCESDDKMHSASEGFTVCQVCDKQDMTDSSDSGCTCTPKQTQKLEESSSPSQAALLSKPGHGKVSATCTPRFNPFDNLEPDMDEEEDALFALPPTRGTDRSE